MQTFVNESSKLVHIYVNGEQIVSTPTHPFYSPVCGWTSAVDLKAGDILVLSNGDYVIVEQVQHAILEAPVKVYNFEVQDFHTYYVGKNSVLVHNMCRINPTVSEVDSSKKNLSEPEIGNKLKYVFGDASGSKHNIDRSLSMQRILNRIGIFNNNSGRQFMQIEIEKAFYDNTNAILQTDGRIAKETLLVGPNGFSKMTTIWDGNKLITIELFRAEWRTIQ